MVQLNSETVLTEPIDYSVALVGTEITTVLVVAAAFCVS